MAIPHFRATFIGTAKSPVAAAAYRHRTAMIDLHAGRTWSYPDDGDLVYSAFEFSGTSPAWLQSINGLSTNAQKSAALWNRAISEERQVNGQTAREFVIALPFELTQAQNIALMHEFVAENFTSRGIVVDWVFHNKAGNPHVHLMHTLRPLTELGFGPKKIATRCSDGNVRRANSGKIIYRDFIGNRDTLIDLRTAWAQTASHHLARAGHDVVLDLSSYASRGIALTPTRHIGPEGSAIYRAGNESQAALAHAEDKTLSAAEITRNPRLILDLVADQMSVFDQRDIARALHRFVDDPATFTSAYTRAIAHPSLVTLAPEVIDATGRLATPARLATTSMIAIEAAMSAQAEMLARSTSHIVTSAMIKQALDACPLTLAAEQTAAIEHITFGPDLVSIVGFAGAGKSTLLAAAKAAWNLKNSIVVGAALASKAANGLSASSGIPSRTIAAWTRAWSLGRDQLSAQHVFVLDEAGMVSSRDMAAIVAEVARSGAKLVLVGDPEQLQPIQAGGAFRALVDQCGAFELSGVRRQTAEWARVATVAFQRGRVAEAVSAYASHDAIVFAPNTLSAAGQLVAEYVAALGTTPTQTHFASQIALAHRNDDILALNLAIRAQLTLGPSIDIATAKGTRPFAAGDRFIFLKNASLPGAVAGTTVAVSNSQLGSIIGITNDTGTPILIVQTDAGASVHLSPADYPHFDLGYATTIHKAQGATVDRAFVLAGRTLDKHLAYVALSRHRDTVRLFVPQSEICNLAALVGVFSRTSLKETTLDYATRRGIGVAPSAPLALDRLIKYAQSFLQQIIDKVAITYARLLKSANGLGVSTYPHSDGLTPPTQGPPTMDIANSHITTKTVGNKIAIVFPRDAEANRIAKDVGARWSKDHDAWVFPRDDAETREAIQEINERAAAMAKSKAIATTVTYASSDIKVGIAGHRLAIYSIRDDTANAHLRALGATWSKDDKGRGAYVVELLDDDHAAEIVEELKVIDDYLVRTVEARKITAGINETYPDIRASVTLDGQNPGSLSLRPPSDRDIRAIIKSAPLNGAWDDKTYAWKIPINAANANTVDDALAKIQARVDHLALTATEITRTITSDHPLLSVEYKDAAVIVKFPKDINASRELTSIPKGFAWSSKLEAYTAVPENRDHADALQDAIHRAGNALDRAIVPHTPDRAGIPALDKWSQTLLYSSIQRGEVNAETVERYATDHRVRDIVDTLVERADDFTVEARAALKNGDAGEFSRETGLSVTNSVRAITIISIAQQAQEQGTVMRAEIAKGLELARSQEAPGHVM